ncbi:MAG: UDP-N-acetylglucosamine--LPS N-acetylglucosamine transferase [Planctomycetota bacterium]
MKRKRRILAVCSGGGHWVQMKRLGKAFDGCHVAYATVLPADTSGLNDAALFAIPDANRETKFRLCVLILRLIWVIAVVRPDVIISTGAAAGYLSIRIGKFLGARTLFVDSIANAEELSMSAKLAKGHADETLSQWESVAESKGVSYWGAVV